MLMQLPVLPPPYSTSLFPVLSSQLRGEYKAAIKRRNRRCYWCGKELAKNGRNCTLDHIFPRSRGGQNTIDNLVLACGSCNMSKGSKSTEEWLQAIETVACQIRKRLAPSSNTVGETV